MKPCSSIVFSPKSSSLRTSYGYLTCETHKSFHRNVQMHYTSPTLVYSWFWVISVWGWDLVSFQISQVHCHQYISSPWKHINHRGWKWGWHDSMLVYMFARTWRLSQMKNTAVDRLLKNQNFLWWYSLSVYFTQVLLLMMC